MDLFSSFANSQPRQRVFDVAEGKVCRFKAR
jgi:hypothetical protein